MFGLKMKKIIFLFPVILICFLSCGSQSPQQSDTASKLAEWRNGVWIAPDGSYSIYTDTHYFVLYLSGDSSNANIYCGASQVKYHNKGMARKQVARFRKLPGRDFEMYKKSVFQSDKTEEKLVIDTTQFSPGTCNIVSGIIYDSITEENDEYILLSSCNGDKIKIFSNGVSVYISASGGEFYSYRIEKL